MIDSASAMANTCSRTTAIPKYLPKEEVFDTTASRLQQTNITQSALGHVVDVSKETRALVVVARTHDVTHWMEKVNLSNRRGLKYVDETD